MNIKVKNIIKDLDLFKNIYDIIRIVDPITKEVYDTVFSDSYNIDILPPTPNNFCYSFWNRDEVCENCVSTRSLKTGKSYVKIEHNTLSSYLVTTSRVIFNDTPYTLELIREIHETDVITSVNSIDYINIEQKLIDLNHDLVIDSLTKAYNKKFIEERIPYNLEFYKKRNNDFSLILCDIDKFKTVNDTYGHLAGDYILKEFVDIIKDNIRNKNDWIGRYGGDEFIIFLDNSNLESSIKVIEKIRLKIKNTPFHFENNEINITASFGLAKPNKNDSYESIIEKCDKNLYISKENGRDRITY